MFLIFDLDDTLYPERSFVDSGFRAVAFWAKQNFNWPFCESYSYLSTSLDRFGRGQVFDRWLESGGKRPTKSLVGEAVRVYRYHDPAIALPDAHRCLLSRLAESGPIHLVTDGHKCVQARKVVALDIEHLFSKIYITHRYGRCAAKPSTVCFELIRRRVNTQWSQMVYVGDDPAKDFVELNQLGVLTIRVLTGRHANVVAKPGYGAHHNIRKLDELLALV